MTNTSFKYFFQVAAPSPIESFEYAESGDGQAISDAVSTGDATTQLLLKAHAEGVREGEERARASLSEQLGKEQLKINEVIRQFQAELSDYYSWVEMEVVQLALAIAGKVLHHEAQVNPGLLAALVKPVLAKLHQSTKVRVHVHPEEAEGCREYFAQDSEVKTVIEVVADGSIEPHNCVLETQLGSTEVGLAAQLKEIEAGMCDLLAMRPAR